MINIDFSGVQLKLKTDGNRVSVFDIIRKKWIILTPEEHVRQYLIHYLSDTMSYPLGRIGVEKQIKVGQKNRRYDIVIFDQHLKPWMIVECKSPDVMINDAALHQLLSYHSSIPCSYWLISNGHQNFCADACDISRIKWLENLPSY